MDSAAQHNSGLRELREAAAQALAKRRYADALQCYRRLEQLQPADASWTRRVADCFRRLGRRRDEVIELVRAAEGYERTGFFSQAAAMYRLAVTVDPAQARLQQRLTELNARRGIGLKGRRATVDVQHYQSPSRLPPPVGLLNTGSGANHTRIVDDYHLVEFDDTDIAED
jgi:tetratricopeptide (TPR) repeat protein